MDGLGARRRCLSREVSRFVRAFSRFTAGRQNVIPPILLSLALIACAWMVLRWTRGLRADAAVAVEGESRSNRELLKKLWPWWLTIWICIVGHWILPSSELLIALWALGALYIAAAAKRLGEEGQASRQRLARFTLGSAWIMIVFVMMFTSGVPFSEWATVIFIVSFLSLPFHFGGTLWRALPPDANAPARARQRRLRVGFLLVVAAICAHWWFLGSARVRLVSHRELLEIVYSDREDHFLIVAADHLAKHGVDVEPSRIEVLGWETDYWEDDLLPVVAAGRNGWWDLDHAVSTVDEMTQETAGWTTGRRSGFRVPLGPFLLAHDFDDDTRDTIAQWLTTDLPKAGEYGCLIALWERVEALRVLQREEWIRRMTPTVHEALLELWVPRGFWEHGGFSYGGDFGAMEESTLAGVALIRAVGVPQGFELAALRRALVRQVWGSHGPTPYAMIALDIIDREIRPRSRLDHVWDWRLPFAAGWFSVLLLWIVWRAPRELDLTEDSGQCGAPFEHPPSA